jgi:hypothetical protein
VSSNEPLDPDGDWVITGNLTLNLRAERLGTGTGRVYTISVQCTDPSGNSSTKTTTVTVPHDSRIKLNVTTTPSSGLAGTYLNIIGSGFPKGALNPANVKVDLAASCGGPPLATTGATSVVPIIGTSERVQFRIPGLAPGRYYVAISDLAVGDANFSSSNCSMLTVAGL